MAGRASLWRPVFFLPEDLTVIGTEAFAGAAASVVDIPAGCILIGNYAFRGCGSLRQIRIPAGCVLGEDMFDDCTLVLIYGTAGSPAETYCLTHSNCVFAAEAQE